MRSLAVSRVGPSERMHSASDAVFCLRRLSRVYRLGESEIHALRALDPDLFRGECVVLLGAGDAGEARALVDMTARRSDFPAQWAGGGRQRVANARALAKTG